MKLQLMLDCNDYRNGSYLGRFDSCDVSWVGMDAMLTVSGPALRTSADGGKLRVGRVRVPHYGESEWVGNWCWNGYLVTLKGALFVLRHLRARGFTPEFGIDPLFPLWSKRDLTREDFLAVLEAEGR